MYITSCFTAVKKSWKFLVTWLLIWIVFILISVHIPDIAKSVGLDLPKDQLHLLHHILTFSPFLLALWVTSKLLKIWFKKLDDATEENQGLYFIEILISFFSKSSQAWTLVIVPLGLLYISSLLRNNLIIHEFFTASAVSFAWSFLYLRDVSQPVKTKFMILFFICGYHFISL